MASMLSIGFVTAATREEVRSLEALPIDSLWVGGHVASAPPTPEAMMQLARLAALSERVRIGTAILLLPLYTPAIVAKQLADLDVYTSGRVTLGVGIGGEFEQEFRACGVPKTQRGARADEAIPLLRRLWTGQEITHEGAFYPMERVQMLPTPAQPAGIPIIVAGREAPAMRRAALLGDGWLPYLYSPRRYAESLEQVKAFAREASRDLSGFQWSHCMFTNVQDDAAAAREDAAKFLGGTYRQDFRELVDRVAAVGTASQVADRVQQFIDAGAKQIIFSVAAADGRLAMMRRIAEEVLPLLGERTS
jgi:probable F420-dependent oxidoreductase